MCRGECIGKQRGMLGAGCVGEDVTESMEVHLGQGV